MAWIDKMISGWIEGLIKAVADFLAKIVETPVLYNESWAVAVRDVTVPVAWSLLVLKVTIEAWKLYIAREAGEQTYGIGVLLRRIAYAGIAIHLSGWAVTWFHELARRLTQAVALSALQRVTDVGNHSQDVFTGMIQTAFVGPTLGLIGSQGATMTKVGLAALKVGAKAGAATATKGALMSVVGFGPLILAAFFIISLAILLAVVWLQSYMRGAELALIFIFGPLFALSAASEDDPFRDGSLGVMAREILVLTMTQVLQMAGLIIVIWYILAHGFALSAAVPCLAFLLVTIRVPTFLRNLIRASGHGSDQGAGQFLTTVVRMGAMAGRSF